MTPKILPYLYSWQCRRPGRGCHGHGKFLQTVLGASQPLPLQPDLCLQRSTKTLPSMKLSGPVASTTACRSDGRSFASPNILTRIRPECTGHLSWMFLMEFTTLSFPVTTSTCDEPKTCHPCLGSATTDPCLAGYPYLLGIVAAFIIFLRIADVC